MTELYQTIKKCINSRRGVKKPILCGSDWCAHCSIPKTQWLQSEAIGFIQGANDPHFITILLKPFKSMNDRLQYREEVLHILRNIGVEGIGSFEFGVKDNHKQGTWSRFAEIMQFMPSLHHVIDHLHIITRKPYDVTHQSQLKLHFPIKGQVNSKPIGTGEHSNKTLNENVAYLAAYPRIKDSCEYSYYKELSVSSEQLAFIVDRGHVYQCKGMKWYQSNNKSEDNSVVNGNGDGFEYGGEESGFHCYQEFMPSIRTATARVMSTRFEQQTNIGMAYLAKMKAQKEEKNKLSRDALTLYFENIKTQKASQTQIETQTEKQKAEQLAKQLQAKREHQQQQQYIENMALLKRVRRNIYGLGR